MSFLFLSFQHPLPPPSVPEFSPLIPQRTQDKDIVKLGQEEKPPIHPSGGCDWLCLSKSTKVFRQLLFLPKIDPPLVEFALLLSSWEFRSPPHGTQFNLHLFSQAFTSWY